MSSHTRTHWCWVGRGLYMRDSNNVYLHKDYTEYLLRLCVLQIGISWFGWCLVSLNCGVEWGMIQLGGWLGYGSALVWFRQWALLLLWVCFEDRHFVELLGHDWGSVRLGMALVCHGSWVGCSFIVVVYVLFTNFCFKLSIIHVAIICFTISHCETFL